MLAITGCQDAPLLDECRELHDGNAATCFGGIESLPSERALDSVEALQRSLGDWYVAVELTEIVTSSQRSYSCEAFGDTAANVMSIFADGTFERYREGDTLRGTYAVLPSDTDQASCVGLQRGQEEVSWHLIADDKFCWRLPSASRGGRFYVNSGSVGDGLCHSEYYREYWTRKP